MIYDKNVEFWLHSNPKPFEPTSALRRAAFALYDAGLITIEQELDISEKLKGLDDVSS